MDAERMQLAGWDRARYFLPTAICVYLCALCLVLIVTSAFLVSVQNAVAVTVAGLFGLLLSGALGYFFWNAQRRDLLYSRVATGSDATANFDAVRSAAAQAGWRISREEPARRLDALTRVTLLDVGERVSIQFRGHDVLIASICDPSVGFSLAGRQHCAEHRELVRQAVTARA
jgi:hypothetical protein